MNKAKLKRELKKLKRTIIKRERAWRKAMKSGHMVIMKKIRKTWRVLTVLAKGRWTLPGGCLDGKENSRNGSAREVCEEVGLKLKKVSKEFYQTKAYGAGKISRIHKAVIKGKAKLKLQADEIRGAVWRTTGKAEKKLIGRHAPALAALI